MKNNFSILSTKTLTPCITQQLVDNDFNVLEHDFIRIEGVKNIDFINAVKTLATNYIFTSKNAVRCFAEQLISDKLSINKTSSFFVLSGETQNALIDEGFKPTTFADNAKDLANKIVKDGKIKEAIFFCGDKRRDDLLATLNEAGISVKEIVLYKNVLQSKRISDAFQAILFFSPSALQSFFDYNELPETVACFCIGHTTANALKEYKINNKVKVISYPSQQVMIDEVLHYFNIKN